MYLLKESCRKVIKIQSRNEDISMGNHDTFCILSLHIASLTQVALMFSLFHYNFTMFVAWYRSATPEIFQDILVYGFRFSQEVSNYFVILIFFAQLIEQWVMLFLINFEKKYTLNEIMFMHKNTKIFRDKESRLKCQILIAVFAFNMIILASIGINYITDMPVFKAISSEKQQQL